MAYIVSQKYHHSLIEPYRENCMENIMFVSKSEQTKWLAKWKCDQSSVYQARHLSLTGPYFQLPLVFFSFP